MNPASSPDAPVHAAAGRSCPLHYRHAPSDMAVPPAPALQSLDVLYVVGGLYGNPLALQQVLALFGQESGRRRLVFNGDFHWFDTDPQAFAAIQSQVLQHTALRGNVETELAAEPDPAGVDAGCGCAYPAWVDDGVVQRSNRILARLRQATTSAQRQALAALPMWLRAEVAGLPLAIVHGDAQSLAGWGFAQEHLRDAAHRATVRGWFEAAQVQAFACSHTCLPVLQRVAGAGCERWVLNNGAAGMPNFEGDAAGLLTRIARTPYTGPQRRLGTRIGPVHVDLLAIEFDAAAWQRQFLQQWPVGSDAQVSYFNRIVQGPAYRPHDALRTED